MNITGKTAAILLSRQPLRPTGRTDWVMGSVRAVNWVKQQGCTLCCSVGMQTWELVLTAGRDAGVPLKCVVPATDGETSEPGYRGVIDDFELTGLPVEFSPVFRECASKDASMKARDRAIVDAADVLIPISVRDGGSMASLIKDAAHRGKQVVTDFQIPWRKRTDRLAYELDADRVHPDISEFAHNYLVHWTRCFNGPWPDELPPAYYRAVIGSNAYPRSAYATLANILVSRKIVASSNHMPQSTATVSFSSQTPSELVRLMKWRARYRRMSFEPYGVGISLPYAERIGIAPVRYYKAGQIHPGMTEKPWLYQSSGKISDWRREKEWRFPGDVDLSAIPTEQLRAFCYSTEEAAAIESRFGIRAAAFMR